VPFAESTASLDLITSLTLAGIASTTSLNFSLLKDLLPSTGDVVGQLRSLSLAETFSVWPLRAPLGRCSSHEFVQLVLMIAGILLVAGAFIALL